MSTLNDDRGTARDGGPAQGARGRQTRCWQCGLAVLGLGYLVGVVFFPILEFSFVDLDVPSQVIENPYIRGLSLANLKHILTSRCVNSYYPVRTLSFAVDYQLWGLDPAGFGFTNILIHFFNVLLVFWLILRLFRRSADGEGTPRGGWEVVAAGFSAALFAAHPVVVEPVAWTAGREELLMVLGALGCVHCHLTTQRLLRGRKSRWAVVASYVGELLCCAVACLSNAVGAVVPALILGWEVASAGCAVRLGKAMAGTLPLWLIGAAVIVIKLLGPVDDSPLGEARAYAAAIKRLVAESAPPTPLGVFSAERLKLVPSVYALNVKSLIWPTRLAVAYSSRHPKSFLETKVVLGCFLLVGTAAVLWVFRRRRLVLYGLLFFAAALAPTAQVLPHHLHRADRFLYLPLAGLALVVASAVRSLGGRLRTRAAFSVAVAAGAGVLLLLDWLSATQVQTWRDSLTMWENCVRADSDNALAHIYLADNLGSRGEIAGAAEHFRIAVRLEPEFIDRMSQLALELATCEPPEQRDYSMAIRLAQQACELSLWQDARPIAALAEVCRAAGQPEMAVAAASKGLKLAESTGNAELAGRLRRLLELPEKR